MTSDKFKPVQNIPKTETKIVLNDWSQPVKKSNLSVAARSKVINRSGSGYLSESGSYGPCSYCNSSCTCYEPYGYAPLYMSCPYCSNKDLSVWTHSGGGCYGPMYISESLYLECKRCYTSGHWKTWQFSCSQHEGYQYATSTASFQDALRLGLALQAGNSQLRDLVKRIGIKLLQES